MDAHAQMIMGKGVIIIPPHDFKRPLRRYFRAKEVANYVLRYSPMA
jgi:hypothetical protein